MYKSIIALFVALIMLTACNSTEADESNTDVVDNNESEVAEDVVQEEPEQLEEDVVEPETEADVEAVVVEPASENEWSSLPEYDTLMKQVDSQDYTFETVTDNRVNEFFYYRTIKVKKNSNQSSLNTINDLKLSISTIAMKVKFSMK